jgi:hypothetical protein
MNTGPLNKQEKAEISALKREGKRDTSKKICESSTGKFLPIPVAARSMA